MVGGNVASSDDMLLVDEDRLDGSGVEGVRNQDDGVEATNVSMRYKLCTSQYKITCNDTLHLTKPTAASIIFTSELLAVRGTMK